MIDDGVHFDLTPSGFVSVSGGRKRYFDGEGRPRDATPAEAFRDSLNDAADLERRQKRFNSGKWFRDP